MFTIRNSGRARRRGWITSAAAVDLNVNSEPPRNIVISVGIGETARDGGDRARREEDPRSALWRRGATTTIASRARWRRRRCCIEHAARRCSSRSPSRLLPRRSSLSRASAETAAVRYERDRIDAWIRNRLIDYPLASCLRCRRPIVAGAGGRRFRTARRRARFHRACHAEWRAEREAAARQALGLEG